MASPYSREFERVGGTQQIRVDVRVIAATNRDLASAMKEGRFREDLFYPLKRYTNLAPALRERKEDIPALARYFVRRFAAETKKKFSGITIDAEAKLMAYPWPGNVRELANVIERAAVLGDGPEITGEDLPLRIAISYGKHRRGAFLSPRRGCCQSGDHPKSACSWNRAAAARILGMHKTHLLNLIKSLRIE